MIGRDIILPTKVFIVKARVFPVVMYGYEKGWRKAFAKEGWMPKFWCFLILVLEKTLESPLNCKEIKAVNPKGNQLWIFTGRTVVEASIHWPPDVKIWHSEKDPDAGKDWRQKEKGSDRGWDDYIRSDQIRSDQSLSRVRLLETPWIAARQASLSITNSQSTLRLTSIESVMPSSYLILCRRLLLLPPIPPSIRVFSNESALRMRWPKYWLEFQL